MQAIAVASLQSTALVVQPLPSPMAGQLSGCFPSPAFRNYDSPLLSTTLRYGCSDVSYSCFGGGSAMTAVPATTEDRTEALWARYRSAGDADARAQLLVRHLGLVHHVAREVSRRIPSVELGELVSAGALGLMKALDSFDLSRGLAFSTYAVLRIRGAILDDLRSRDSTPRSVRVKRRRIEAVAAALEAKLGRAPTPQEVADQLGIDLATYWKWKDAVGVYAEAEAPRPSHGRRFSRDAETHADPSATLPTQKLVESEHVAHLRKLISRLPEQQRRVLALYYYEELNLRQVGEVLQVSESRVSQIRSQALKRLRQELAESAVSG
jgi:RNA polymerase sigma factor FliA